MPTLEPYEKLLTTIIPLPPVPRTDVEAYLQRFSEVSRQLGATANPDKMDWDAWRSLRHPDYFIQWNIRQGRFRISREEYIDRWNGRSGRGAAGKSSTPSSTSSTPASSLRELLRSTHLGADGKRFVFPLCETYHIRDGKAVYSNEYIDPTDLRPIDQDIPGGW